MPGNFHGRRNARQDVRQSHLQQADSEDDERLIPPAGVSLSPRLIGLPVQITIPQIEGIRWRHCERWDEEPAATLGMSLLRLEICRPRDWTGSAVDFVERGFKRFAQANGIDTVRKVWQGDIRIMDHMFELSERERDRTRAEMDDPAQTLFLVIDFSSAASIPIGAALTSVLEREHSCLPAAFFVTFRHCLEKWMLAL